MHASRERPGLCGVTACRWTVNWACPGSAAPGRRGYAHDDGTHAFRCCCPVPSSLLPPPPPPAPPPPVFLHAFFGCERGTLEGERVQLAGGEEDTRWLVVKSRDVGEPAPRLCEAELQHRGTAQPHGHQRAGLALPSLGPCAASVCDLRLQAARGAQCARPGYWSPSHCLASGAQSEPPPKVADRTLCLWPFRRSCLGRWPMPSG